MDVISWLKASYEVGSIQVSIGDALGFATGLMCVWLTAKASIWNFFWGIINCAILGVLFFDQRLFADASLQIVFVALAVVGWVNWSKWGHSNTAPFKATSVREQVALVAVASALSLALYWVLVQLRGSSPPLDAMITALSLCAQWQLNRRQVSSWIWWIAVDLISIPLYWSRDMHLIAGLYVIFLLMCVYGLHNWRRTQRLTHYPPQTIPA